jgi:uncharacterized protein (DUF1697 family)
MAELRELFGQAGLGGARTYVQTGNVVFEFAGGEAEAAARIDAALAARGLRNAAASVRSAVELDALVATGPFDRLDAVLKDRFVSLFQVPIPADVSPRLERLPGVVAVREREILTVRVTPPPPRSEDVGVFLAKALALQGTTRYWHIVQEVARLARDG